MTEQPEGREVPWTRHDLGAALQHLRSLRPGVVRRALRRLHIRWYHAGARRMKDLLTAAGVDPATAQLVDEVVSTCSICRMWVRPGPKSVTSTRFPHRFNDTVEYDLLFVKRYVILHMIDTCIRWSAGKLVFGRDFDSLKTGMYDIWFSKFGYPQELVGDKEGSLDTEEAAAHFAKLGIKLTLRARGQHAGMVERHNELLRSQFHKVEGQAIADGLRVDVSEMLSESLFAKNVLCVVGGYSPYQALYGRTPPILDVLSEEAPESDFSHWRLRQIAVEAMIQATAEQKASRAEKSKSRPAGELQGLAAGDQVEFFRPPTTKDHSGWHGPALVADVTSLSDGVISVKWQSRIIACRVQDVRRALVYLCLHSSYVADSPIDILFSAAERTNSDVIRVGWLIEHGSWISCEANRHYGKVLLAGLYVSACCLHLDGVVSFRFGRHARGLTAVACDDSLVLWWETGRRECWYNAFVSGAQYVNFVRLAGGRAVDMSFVQFFMMDSESVREVRGDHDDVPNLGGPYEPRLPRLLPVSVTDTVLSPARRRARAIADVSETDPIRNDSSVAQSSGDAGTSGDHGVEYPRNSVQPVEPTLATSEDAVFLISNDQQQVEDDDEPAELVFDRSSFHGIDKLAGSLLDRFRWASRKAITTSSHW